MAQPNFVLRSVRNLSLGLLLLSPALQAQEPEAGAAELKAARKAVRMQQFDEALRLYKQAASQGIAEAQYQLAMLYLQGNTGQKNPDQAVRWLEEAIKQDHSGAQYLLALEISEQQPERARNLLKASAKQGYPAAVSRLERVANLPSSSSREDIPLQERWFGAIRNDDLSALKQLKNAGADPSMVNEAGRNGLFTAIEASANKALEWLLEQNLDPNHKDKFGLTATQTAVERAELGALKMLLKAGAQKDQTFSNGDNLLHYAIRMERFQTAQYLVAQGIAINHKNKEGWTPLDLAEYKKLNNFVALLNAKNAQHGDNWRKENHNRDFSQLATQLEGGNLPPAVLAVTNSNLSLLKEIAKKDPSSLDVTLEDGSSLLMLAVKQNKAEIISELLKHKLSVNSGGYRGWTALHLAAKTGNQEIVNRLLEKDADPLIKDDDKRDAIEAAIEQEHAEIAIILLERIIGDSGYRTEVKRTISSNNIPIDQYLLLSTQHHLPEVTARLLPYAGDVSAVDELNRNALWFAAKEKNPELIKSLLKAGVDAEVKDNLGRTPFIVAVESGCLECAQQLLSNINETTDSGNTALMAAAQNGDAKMTAWLLKNKADVEIRNKRGNTAIMEAVNANSMETVKLLVKAKANVTRKNKLGFSAIDLAKQVSPQMEELLKEKSVLGIFH